MFTPFSFMATQASGGLTFTFTVKSDNAGTSGTDQFTIPTSTYAGNASYLYNVTTSDGYSATGLTGAHTITFPTGAGTHTVYITGVFPAFNFAGGGDGDKLLTVDDWGVYGIGSVYQGNAFRGCDNLVINAVDTGTWGGVNVNISSAFRDTGLISFPLLAMNANPSFNVGWYNSTSLANFPANFFDSSISNAFALAFTNTNLTSTSIDNILVSLDTAGQVSGSFDQSGGSSPSATGLSAKTNLQGKAWTVTTT